MASQNQLVGIIEIDADPALDALSDGSLHETLRAFRCPRPQCDGFPHCSLDSYEFWADAQDSQLEGGVVLAADVRQLHRDLEEELAVFIDRLLTAQ